MNTDHIVIPFTAESDVTTPMHLSISDSVLSAPWHAFDKFVFKPRARVLLATCLGSPFWFSLALSEDFIVPSKIITEPAGPADAVRQVTLNKTLL